MTEPLSEHNGVSGQIVDPALKLSAYRLELLINFNVVLIKDGVRRMIRSL